MSLPASSLAIRRTEEDKGERIGRLESDESEECGQRVGTIAQKRLSCSDGRYITPPVKTFSRNRG